MAIRRRHGRVHLLECPKCGADLEGIPPAKHFRQFHDAEDFLGEGSR